MSNAFAVFYGSYLLWKRNKNEKTKKDEDELKRSDRLECLMQQLIEYNQIGSLKNKSDESEVELVEQVETKQNKRIKKRKIDPTKNF